MEKFQGKKAFSLIELLVSLIIISLLIAAFSPLITKKLKANDITVGSFGNASNNSGSNTNNNSTNVTKEYCESLNAIYVPIGQNVPKPLCVMKYNIGDVGIEDWTGVQKCEAGKDCEVQNGKNQNATIENLQATCWVATSDKNTAGACNNNFGGYDGCKRTLCNWTGANKMCNNIGWRLPTMPELIAFTNDTYSSKDAFEKGNGSLMFCDYSTSSISPQCQGLAAGCSGTWNGNCYPYYVWSSSFSSSSKAWYRHFDRSWRDNADYLGYDFSARCVLDSMQTSELGQETQCYDFFCESCKDKQYNSCKKCKNGYVLHDGKCYFGKLEGCNNPTFDDTYQVVNCASCKENYTKCDSGSCASNEAIAKSCPAHTRKVGCTCVMQYNIGDNKYIALGEDITKVKICTPGDKNCSVLNGTNAFTIARDLEPACWRGNNTAVTGTCNANYGGYSGCYRTLCNWRGAYDMCNNIGWRLPTMPELKIYASITHSSSSLGASGLMFCDYTDNSAAPFCAAIGDWCFGSFNAICYPHFVWSSSFQSPQNAWARALGKNWEDYLDPIGADFATRCVKDL